MSRYMRGLFWFGMKEKYAQDAQKKPTSSSHDKSDEVIGDAVEVLFKAKLYFFKSIIPLKEPFQSSYQTNVSYLMISLLSSRHWWRDSGANTSILELPLLKKTCQIDITQKESHLPLRKVDIVFLAEEAVYNGHLQWEADLRVPIWIETVSYQFYKENDKGNTQQATRRHRELLEDR